MFSTPFRGSRVIAANRNIIAAVVLACPAALGAAPALAQGRAGGVEELPILVVTPFRGPAGLDRSGSAITVVDRQQIEAWGTKSLADVLRGTPGLDITENGGPGSLSNVTLRGSNPGQTLILIDGIRAGDSSNIDGSFDFATLSALDVKRIEVLRGPQSALYGSDAMGGVVNIITRKGAAKPQTILTLEGGSFGTISSSLSTRGSTEKLSYAFSIQGLHMDGFSRYGYRIGRITSQFANRLERDKTDKAGASGRIAYTLAPGTEVEVGFRTYTSAFRFDNPGAFFLAAKDTRLNKGHQNVTLGFVRARHAMLDGKLQNSLKLSASQTNRFNRLEQSCFDAVFNSFDCEVRFKSQRMAIEYQGDLKLGRYGTFIFGARSEREQASGSEKWIAPPSAVMPTFKGNQTTNSVFALHRVDFGQLGLSLGGRVDTVDGKETFPTWRATATYSIAETGTKLRVSAGTGAKAPTLFQRFSIYGTPGLQAEENLSIEAGVDQKFWNGRGTFSLTAFDTRYRNLIGFNFALNNGIGGYYNVGRANIKGFEAAANIIVVPEAWRMRAAYTYLHAVDSVTGLQLLRRPKHKGFVSLVYTGIPKIQIEGRITFVGSRIDIANDFPYARVRMAPFAKLDGRISYQVSEKISLFARIENATNARYQEIRDYGVAGRSFYAGARIVW